MTKLFAALAVIPAVLFILFLLALITAIITQYAWSQAIVPIFHLPDLTFWQAFWMNVLGSMLFKSSSVSKS